MEKAKKQKIGQITMMANKSKTSSTGQPTTSLDDKKLNYVEFLAKNGNSREIKISIIVPEFYRDEIKLNSRESMIYDILTDLSKTDDALYVNKFKVFWEHEKPPIKALIKPTQERSKIIKKLMNRYER